MQQQKPCGSTPESVAPSNALVLASDSTAQVLKRFHKSAPESGTKQTVNHWSICQADKASSWYVLKCLHTGTPASSYQPASHVVYESRS